VDPGPTTVVKPGKVQKRKQRQSVAGRWEGMAAKSERPVWGVENVGRCYDVPESFNNSKRLMKGWWRKGVESADREKRVSKQKQKKDTPAAMSERRETPNDVSELGVVVVDPKKDKRPGVWVLDPMKTLK
jgi:hypothetical protein